MAQSNQLRTITQAAGKFRNVSTSGAKFNVGNQVRIQANNKGTGVAGRPSALGEKSKDTKLAAVENPAGKASR